MVMRISKMIFLLPRHPTFQKIIRTRQQLPISKICKIVVSCRGKKSV